MRRIKFQCHLLLSCPLALYTIQRYRLRPNRSAVSPGRPELCNSNCIEYLIDDSIGRVTGYVIGNIPGYPGSDLSRTIPACTWLENNVNYLTRTAFSEQLKVRGSVLLNLGFSLPPTVLQTEVGPFSDGHLPEITPGCTTLLTNSIRFMPASRMSAISLRIRGQSVNLHQLNEELAP